MMKKVGAKQFLTLISLCAGILLGAAPVYGQDRLLHDEYPDSYTVVKGDTLWDIAGQFLQDPRRWEEVWQQNPQVDNPDLIYPGDILRIGLVEGNPRILVQRGDRLVQRGDTVVQRGDRLVQRGDRLEVRRLSPEIRVLPLVSAIPTIPLEDIENSFTRNRIVDPAMIEAAPHIVANLDNNLVIGTGDEVYARGLWPDGTGSFEVYRAGRVYFDHSGTEQLGQELEYLGFATIVEDAGPGLKRMLINNSSREIQVGDRLLVREESSIGSTIFPSEPEAPVSGMIIGFLGASSLASQLDTVVIDLGSNDQLEVGNILSIKLPGPQIVDVVERGQLSFRQRISAMFNQEQLQLPGKDIGTLLVYKTFEQLSYALILSSLEPAQLYNQVVNP